MAQNGRFGLSLRVLALLAQTPDKMQTSAAIAEALGASAVMVRRTFPALHDAGFVAQRKGPQGGVRLKIAAKEIGVGDVFTACSGDWPVAGDQAMDAALKRVRADAVKAMNETTLASLVKRMKKGAA